MKKRILCYGDSNTWGYDAFTDGRFGEEVRWTGVLQKLLGEDYIIIEEGLCGRTTVFEDPLNEGLNGLTYIHPCMMTHSPMDCLVIMLGTNDCKERFGVSARNIACGMKRLLIKALQTPAWRKLPHILLVAPGGIEKGCESSPVASEMGKCSEKSQELAQEYRRIAEELQVEFLDAGEVVRMNTLDYMHLDARSHERLAYVIEKKLKEILASDGIK